MRAEFARTQEEREVREQPRGGDNMIIVLRPQVVKNLVNMPWKPLEGTEKEDEVMRHLLVNTRKLLAAAMKRLEAELQCLKEAEKDVEIKLQQMQETQKMQKRANAKAYMTRRGAGEKKEIVKINLLAFL